MTHSAPSPSNESFARCRLLLGPLTCKADKESGRAPQGDAHYRRRQDMTKTIFKKVAWLGRATTFLVGLAVVLALSVGLASTALAGTGVGARFDLGKTNTVSAVTKLVGSVAGPSLQIDNNSTNAAATTLDLQVEAGKTPMKVNSAAKVANLNADKLDGMDASQLGGLSGVTQVEQPGGVNDSVDTKTTSATCPVGTVAIAGGGRTQGVFTAAALIESRRDFGDPRTWVVRAHEPVPTSELWSLGAFAICATARP